MDAPKDNNFIKARLGVLFSDGVTLIPIAIDPVSGGMKINTTDVISQTAINVAPRDANFTPAWMGKSSIDNSPVPIYVDATGAVLVDL